MSEPNTTPNATPNGAKGIVVVPSAAMVPHDPVTGEVLQSGFGTTSMERRAETSSTALAASQKAQVEARFIMALQHPRNMERVRLRVLDACKRPRFAEKAIYAKPVGQKLNKETGEWEEAFAEGLSIRFAEEAIRSLGNAMTETITIYDDASKRIVRVTASDLETNAFHSKDVVVEKTVERKKLKNKQVALGQRRNSYGDLVYIVEATEDDLLTKVGAAVAKALRDKILMLLPSDIQEEARETIYATQDNEHAKDPQAAKKKLVDAFAAIGVMPEQLVEYLGHDLNTLTPAERQRLFAIGSGIKDGEATWADVVENKRDWEKEYAAKVKAKAEAEAEALAKAAEAVKAAGGAPAAAATGTPAAAAPETPKVQKGKANLADLAKDQKAKREATAKPEEKPAEDKPAEDKGDAPTAEEIAQQSKARQPGEEG